MEDERRGDCDGTAHLAFSRFLRRDDYRPHAAFPGQNGKIAYVRYDQGDPYGRDNAIVLSNEDGGQVRAVTPWLAHGLESPSWSPDGTKLAFAYRGDIMVMNADGRAVTQITGERAYETDPAWAPDGYHLAFTQYQWPASPTQPPFTRDVYITNLDRGDPVRLTETGGADRPSWSPDGATLAFEDDGAVYVVNADGIGSRQVTGNGHAPDWSPDGTKIAFHRWFDVPDGVPEPRIFTIEPDGSGEAFLTAYGVYAEWSPDGEKLVATTSEDPFVFVVDLAGGARTMLDPYSLGLSPSWQPRPHTILGSAKGDILRGTVRSEIIEGRRGDDRLFGKAGHDALYGGRGDDRVFGGTGRDTLFGGPGEDLISSVDGRQDLVFCGPGIDRARVDGSATQRQAASE